MIVVMAYVAQKHRAVGDVRKPAVLERKRALGRPPGIEMATLVAAEARAPPAAVDSLGGLVMLPAGIDGQALHQERGAPADRIAAVLGEFLQKFLVAKNLVGRFRGCERLDEC